MQREDRQKKGDTWDEQLTGTRGFCQGRELQRAGSSTAGAACRCVCKGTSCSPTSTAKFLRPRSKWHQFFIRNFADPLLPRGGKCPTPAELTLASGSTQHPVDFPLSFSLLAISKRAEYIWRRSAARRNQDKARQSVVCSPALAAPTSSGAVALPWLRAGRRGHLCHPVTQRAPRTREQPRLCSSSLFQPGLR